MCYIVFSEKWFLIIPAYFFYIKRETKLQATCSLSKLVGNMICQQYIHQVIRLMIISSGLMFVNSDEELKYATGTIQVGNFDSEVPKCTQALTQTCQQIFIGQAPSSQTDCKSKSISSNAISIRSQFL